MSLDEVSHVLRLVLSCCALVVHRPELALQLRVTRGDLEGMAKNTGKVLVLLEGSSHL